ncbi:MAG: LPS-assembly protein LptD, partial [Candidatus Omnitrophica bacterium]|nr:LPS-assembly protein LptD [Candidatus Omnitrophota bacterium]
MKNAKRIKMMVLAVACLGAWGRSGVAWSADLPKETLNAEAVKPVADPRAGTTSAPVELNGDTVEFKADQGKMIATGNVVLRQNSSALFCDQLEFYKEKQEAHATGNVILESDKGTIWADKGFYNFQTKRGEFTNARILAKPIFGEAETITKVRDDYYVMSNGYLTTSDYDDPEWRVKSNHIELFPGDKAIARNSTMYVGAFPVMYLSKYTQFLDDNRPHLRVLPGYSKDFGAYVLMSSRYNWDTFATTYNVDLRERRGIGYGIDLEYNSAWQGRGLVRTYYTDEHATDRKYIWESTPNPSIEHKRYRAEWREQMTLDPQTTFIGQYSLASDATFVKEYFEREYLADSSPATYALLTHSLPNATLTLRADVRVNHYQAGVERLPEAGLSVANLQVGNSGFYVKSGNTLSNLVYKDAAPSDNAQHTERFDTDNELSRPFKAGIFEMRPYVGTEQTYYSHALYADRDNSMRGIFKSGMDVSTKFYRLFDVDYHQYGMDINKLRHVITPTVAYQYQRHPTLSSANLFQYDGVDSRDQIDQFGLGLQNTLQTKQEGKNVDLVQSLLTTNYRMEDNASGRGFSDAKLDDSFFINKNVTIHHDLTYALRPGTLTVANVDMYFKDNKKWEFDVGRRFTRHDDDLVTTQLTYKFNPKWRAVVYERWNVDTGNWQEQQYSFVRDLHSWEVEFAINNKKEPVKSG